MEQARLSSAGGQSSRLAAPTSVGKLARAYLLYGERLRRENRPVDARGQQWTDYEMLTTVGIEGPPSGPA